MRAPRAVQKVRPQHYQIAEQRRSKIILIIRTDPILPFGYYDTVEHSFAGCGLPALALIASRRHHCYPLYQPALEKGPVHRRHSRRRDIASKISCTAINRPMVAHEDSEVPLHLQEGIAAIPQYASAFYRFTRPHTMLGTFISVTSVSALAVVGFSSTLISYSMSCHGLCQAFATGPDCLKFLLAAVTSSCVCRGHTDGRSRHWPAFCRP